MPCAFGRSGSMRIAAFELRSQACHNQTIAEILRQMLDLAGDQWSLMHPTIPCELLHHEVSDILP
jgi:hypothetical protein